jgi:hypothetical protein
VRKAPGARAARGGPRVHTGGLAVPAVGGATAPTVRKDR